MRIRWVHIASTALIFAVSPVWSLEGQGLEPTDSDWLSGQWQARVEHPPGLVNPSNSTRYNIAPHAHGTQWPGLSVLGDFYFKSHSTTGTPSTAFSGFRATSGLMVGSRRFAGSSSDGNGDTGPVPYFGIGYTDLPDRAGWGFRADFGMMALSPRSAVKLGGALGGGQNIDDLLRDLRLSPLIQLGVSYSF